MILLVELTRCRVDENGDLSLDSGLGQNWLDIEKDTDEKTINEQERQLIEIVRVEPD